MSHQFGELSAHELDVFPGVPLELAVRTMIVGDRPEGAVGVHCPSHFLPVDLVSPHLGFGKRWFRGVAAFTDENDSFASPWHFRTVVCVEGDLTTSSDSERATLVHVAEDLPRITVLDEKVVWTRNGGYDTEYGFEGRKVFRHNIAFRIVLQHALEGSDVFVCH